MKILKPSAYNLIFGIVFLLFIPQISAQGNSGDNGNAGGVFTYEFIPRNDLHFGTFSIDQNTAGTITVDFDGVATDAGGANLVPIGLQPIAGEFQINVTQGKATVSFNSLTSSGELTSVGSNSTLKVDNLTFDQNSVYIDKFNSPYTIKMGGTLTIPPAATHGNYSGSINVVINYQ